MTEWRERHVPKIALAPSFVAILIFADGSIAWAGWRFAGKAPIRAV